MVEEAPDPRPGEAESLVQVTAGAVAHVDLTVARGDFAFRPELPYVPGTEGAGRVVASKRFPLGAAVRIRGGGVGLRRDGTWAERAAVPDEAIEPVPADVDPVVAAVFFSPCVTAHLAVHEVGGVRVGERVGVRGAAGAVGSIAVQLALEAGAEVVGTESSRERAASVPAGAHAGVGDEELSGLDVLVDLVGGAGLSAVVTRAMKPGGRVVLVGYTGGTEVTFDLPALLAADVRLLPVNLIRAEASAREEAERLLARVQRGELHLDVTTYPLEHAAEAMDALRRGAARGKVAVVPPDEGRDE